MLNQVLAEVIRFENPLQTPSFRELMNNLINFVFTFALPLTVVAIILGGILIVTAGGDERKIALGKKFVVAALVGLIIVISARGIMSLLSYLIKR